MITTFNGRRAKNPDSSTGGTEFGESSEVNGLTAIESESTQSGIQTLWSSLNIDTSLTEKITKKRVCMFFSGLSLDSVGYLCRCKYKVSVRFLGKLF